jgi:hypothetical protein
MFVAEVLFVPRAVARGRCETAGIDKFIALFLRRSNAVREEVPVMIADVLKVSETARPPIMAVRRPRRDENMRLLQTSLLITMQVGG